MTFGEEFPGVFRSGRENQSNRLSMCKIMQEYEDIARDEGCEEGLLPGTIKAFRRLVIPHF